MRIAFDHQIFSSQSYGGVSRYFARLAEALLEANQEVRVFAPIHRNSYLAGLPEGAVWGRGVGHFPPKTARLVKAFDRLTSTRAMRTWRPHVIHETYYARRRSGPRACPTVITVYDMIHELLLNEGGAGAETVERKQTAISRADRVICISESTRQDLHRLYDIREDKTSVVHLGYERFGVDPGQKVQALHANPFLLYVGARGGYKNFLGFLQAVSQSSSLLSDFEVVAFGGGTFSKQERMVIHDLGFRSDRVRQVGGDDTILGSLYEAAIAFVYPSLYEGFGLPPLEAMAHDCPVVSSNTSSMPEVMGPAAEFFDPHDVEDIMGAIEQVAYSEERRGELIRLGHARLARFSWSKCAEETLAVYRELGA
ncbi:MAG: glycosyltransferase family 4 protein [Thermoleophilia bacterium]